MSPSRGIRTDRLLKLADFLETVPPKAFDIHMWQTTEATKPEGDTPGECGFAGCAVGWAAHQKMFRGLYLKAEKYSLPFPHYQPSKKSELRIGDEAIMAVFGISGMSVDRLFYATSYPKYRATPKQVAARIRQFVKQQEVR